jgi:hypothetical protein
MKTSKDKRMVKLDFFDFPPVKIALAGHIVKRPSHSLSIMVIPLGPHSVYT